MTDLNSKITFLCMLPLLAFLTPGVAMNLDLDFRLACTLDSVFSPDEAIFEDRLLGEWQRDTNDSKESLLTFSRNTPGEKVYRVVFHGSKHQCLGHLFRVNNNLILDLVVLLEDEYEKMFLRPVHHYWGISYDGEKMTFSFLSMQIGAQLRKEELKSPCKEFDEMWLLTGSRDQIMNCLQKAIEETKKDDHHKVVLRKK